MVLLVVDAQEQIVTEKLYRLKEFIECVTKLISLAREHKVEVIYIRHDDGTELTKGAEGFDIYSEFMPSEDERIFDKNVNSAFRGTGLLRYLQSKQEDKIMIVGLQTDYCIDATIKCGFEHGFEMIVPEHGNTTEDNEYMTGEQSYYYYNNKMWNKRYATCVSFEEAVSMFQDK